MHDSIHLYTLLGNAAQRWWRQLTGSLDLTGPCPAPKEAHRLHAKTGRGSDRFRASPRRNALPCDLGRPEIEPLMGLRLRPAGVDSRDTAGAPNEIRKRLSSGQVSCLRVLALVSVLANPSQEERYVQQSRRAVEE